jgi:hypothetical protein
MFSGSGSFHDVGPNLYDVLICIIVNNDIFLYIMKPESSSIEFIKTKLKSFDSVKIDEFILLNIVSAFL